MSENDARDRRLARMAKVQREELEPVYGAAKLIVDEGLRRDGSLFTPDRSIWTLANFEELERDYVQQP